MNHRACCRIWPRYPVPRFWRSPWCIRSRLPSAGGSAVTTSSTSRGAWASSRSPPSPPHSATATRTRRWLLLALVSIWGVRLSWHIQRKTVGKGEDPPLRRRCCGDRHRPLQVLRKVFLLQGFITWFVSFPLQLSAVTGPTPNR